MLAAGLLAAVLVSGCAESHPADPPHDGVNFSLSVRAATRDVGLPMYPGARLDEKNGKENNMAHVMAALGPHEFRLEAMRLISQDPPEKIVRFYRRALARYGRVVDCVRPENARAEICDKGETQADYVLKSGRADDQHSVEIERKDGKTEISLVYLHLKGLDN